MSTLNKDIESIAGLKAEAGSPWDAINPESAARMRAQNKFKNRPG